MENDEVEKGDKAILKMSEEMKMVGLGKDRQNNDFSGKEDTR